MKETPGKKNISGRMLRRMRKLNGWTQEVMSEKLRDAGWDKCKRSWLARVEIGTVSLKDYQIGFLRDVFGEDFEKMFWSAVSVVRTNRSSAASATATTAPVIVKSDAQIF